MSVKALNFSDLKVLVVDDQDEVRAMVHNMLVELGINQVYESMNGREALDFLGSGFADVDVIICDWNMPKMSGVELLRQLRTTHPDMPFLMITGRSDINSVVEAKSSGVTAYVSKPFTPQQLEAKLYIILHRIENAKAS